MNILNSLLNLIYPIRCSCCDCVADKNGVFCTNCIKNIIQNEKISYLCNDQIICISPFKYIGNIRTAIHKFKFKGKKQYSKAFSKFMFEDAIIHYNDVRFDVVTSVPMSKRKLQNRKYNQATLLGKELAKSLNFPFDELLLKIKENEEQHKLSAAKRKLNVKGVYAAVNKEMIKNKTILICDDILTTGNTLEECCSVLINSGAKDVFCITLAKA